MKKNSDEKSNNWEMTIDKPKRHLFPVENWPNWIIHKICGNAAVIIMNKTADFPEISGIILLSASQFRREKSSQIKDQFQRNGYRFEDGLGALFLEKVIHVWSQNNIFIAHLQFYY